MPAPRKKTKTKPAAAKRKPAAIKRKPAAKRPPEPEIQVNRTVTETPTAPPAEDTPPTENAGQDAPPTEPQEETKAELAKAGADRARVVEQRNAEAGDARREQVMTPERDPSQVYEPEREPLEHEGFDHQAAEDKRQAELQAERDEHNERTGDASRA